jgi:hypothetical protein
MSAGKCKVACTALGNCQRCGRCRTLVQDIVGICRLSADRKRRYCAYYNDVECVGLIRDRRSVIQRVDCQGKGFCTAIVRQADVGRIKGDGAVIGCKRYERRTRGKDSLNRAHDRWIRVLDVCLDCDGLSRGGSARHGNAHMSWSWCILEYGS